MPISSVRPERMESSSRGASTCHRYAQTDLSIWPEGMISFKYYYIYYLSDGCTGMGAIGILLVAAVVIITLALLAFIIRSAQAGQVLTAAPPTGTGPSHIPEYSLQVHKVEYFRPGGGTTMATAAPSTARERDPRAEPLPHCPRCNAAVGFDDRTCPRCRCELRA